MPERVNTPERLAVARAKIGELLAAQVEWFCTVDGGPTEPLRRSELELAEAHGRLILWIWTALGNRHWKIYSWEWTGEKLLLRTSRRMGAERPLLELVPRATSAALAATVKAARQARCRQMAELAAKEVRAKVERAALSPGARRGQPGKYARIVLRQQYQRIAVTGSVATVKASDADDFLASALLWFKRTSERARSPFVQQLWLAVEPQLVKPISQRVALLRPALRDAISVFAVDQPLAAWQRVAIPERAELWKQRLRRFPPVAVSEASEFAGRLRAIAPEAIDVVSARKGETLRYFGLPFARVRRLLGSERVWFGVAGARRQALDEQSENELANLLLALMAQRAANSPDHHHVLYRNAAEGWLESLLRRDITRLDPGLIIAPLHAQFRTSRGGVLSVRPIDLLALRQDGRLVVIELKVTEAREHVLQGVDYWQRVEAHRRRGHIARAKLFGERKISDQPPLIYLVAPTLRVHPACNTLARAIAPDIEIYRFDINEDWRAGVRVMRRVRAS